MLEMFTRETKIPDQPAIGDPGVPGPGSCECLMWACHDVGLIIEGNGHHPHCKHYQAPPIDPRHARFGEAMWEYILKRGGEFCGDEISEDILPLAERAGLCHRVRYDPEIHGDGIDVDEGDEIWWWGYADVIGLGCSGMATEEAGWDFDGDE